MKTCSFCGCINGENNLNCHQCGLSLSPSVCGPVCEWESPAFSLFTLGTGFLILLVILCLLLFFSTQPV